MKWRSTITVLKSPADGALGRDPRRVNRAHLDRNPPDQAPRADTTGNYRRPAPDARLQPHLQMSATVNVLMVAGEPPTQLSGHIETLPTGDSRVSGVRKHQPRYRRPHTGAWSRESVEGLGVIACR